MFEKDYYSILGVSRTASQDELRASYRKLALQYHPDRNKNNPAATEKMKELNEAYAVLSDPNKRQEYDRLWQEEGQSASERYRQTHTAEDIFRGSDVNQVFSEMAKEFGLRNFDKVFRQAYGQRYRSFEFQNKGMYGRAFIFYGTSRRGPAQSGRSQEINQGAELTKLVQKMASGRLLPKRGKDRKNDIVLTPKLAREGGEAEIHVNQHGTIKTFKVKIPVGIRSGQQIKLKGLGDPGSDGGQPGDLYLRVRFDTPLLERFIHIFKK